MKVQQIKADGKLGVVHAVSQHTERGIDRGLGGRYFTLCGLELRDYDWRDRGGRLRIAPMVVADGDKPDAPVSCKNCLKAQR